MKNLFLKNKINNHGASLVFVLVTFAISTILVTLVLMASLWNIKMKAIDANAKNSFYSCEGVVSEIKAGLQNQVSTAYTEAYTNVMERYTSMDRTQRQEKFENLYIDTLRAALKETGTQSYYSLDLLKGYVTKTPLKTDTSVSGAEVTTVFQTAGETGQGMNYLTPVKDGLALKNLRIRYTDEKGNLSQIRTDIILEYPSVNFTQTSAVPSLLDFTVLAENSLINDTGASTIAGSLYGGENGIKLNAGSLAVSKADVAVTNKMVDLAAGTTFSTGSKTNLWADGVNIVSAALNLNGSTYLQDDLTVTDQSGSASSITVSGNYFGYGNPVTAARAAEERLGTSSDVEAIKTDITANPNNYSSSIVVNGTNVTMNFSGIEYLMLSGNAYISTKAKNTETITNAANVMTGESLTVKSNQLAYLVPSSLIGQKYTNGGQNPMTADTYEALRKEAGLTTENDDKLVALDSVKSLGASSYEKAYYQAYNSYMVYFYLKFDTALEAAKYFKTYYADSANQTELNRYVKFYLQGVTMNSASSAKFDLNGNILSQVDTTNNTVTEQSDTLTDGAANTTAALTERQVNLQNKFAAYRLKLVSNYSALSETEKKQNVFKNLVDLTKLTTDLNNVTNQTMTFQTEKSSLSGILTKKNVVVKNGTGTNSLSDDVLTVYTGSGTAASPYLRVIISTGNVVVENSNFSGLIISNGTVTLKNNSNLQSAPEEVAKVLETETNNNKIMNYIYDASSYIIGGATSGNAGSVDSTSIEDLIVYQNWVKQ